jgi:phage tail-like protein
MAEFSASNAMATNFFTMEFNGLLLMICQKVTGGKADTKKTEYSFVDEKGVPQTIYITGKSTWSDIIVERAIMEDAPVEMDLWLKQVREGDLKGAMRDLKLVLRAADGRAIKSYDIFKALPHSVELGTLDAAGSMVITEKITFSIREIRAEKA